MDASLIIAIATMGGLGFIFAGGLAFADRKLRVEENPLIAQINDALPGANCGACGKAGCYDFAVNLVEGKGTVNGCPVGGNEAAQAIANILGVEAGSSVKMYPRIHCRGGAVEAAAKTEIYNGPLSCSIMNIVSGGNKLCNYGCLGGGDCVNACPFGAMVMNENGLPELIEELCTGCGVCSSACPKDLIEMMPEHTEVFIFCNNHDDPKTAKEVCSAACTGCGICARNTDGIEMDNFLPVIYYSALDESQIPFDKCKTKAIGRVDKVITMN